MGGGAFAKNKMLSKKFNSTLPVVAETKKLVDNPTWWCEISKYLWDRNLFRIRDWNRISQKDRGVGVKF
jgi:hypothetical protein